MNHTGSFGTTVTNFHIFPGQLGVTEHCGTNVFISGHHY